MRSLVGVCVLIACGLSACQALAGYSVLTHEAIIDSAWDDSLKPLIRARFPDVTDEQLVQAHAYAYGGAIIQDMGYYPFSSKLFSDLVHYVRAGDFVTALLNDASDPNQFAFALGALAHYASDDNGHPIAINHAVPMLYPKLRSKYGDPMTYEDNPPAHLKTEFGFDVLGVARGSYAPKSYHDFIGFEVSKPLLERAFEETYSIPLKSLFKSLDLALGTFRSTVGGLIPEMTRAAWNAKKKDIQKATPGVTRRRFVYNLSRGGFEKEWGHNYERPGLGARMLTFMIRVLPKVGPFKAFAFRIPTPETEKLFMQSFNQTLSQYRTMIQGTRANRLTLPERNLDTGQPVRQGTYRLADRAYQDLLEKLADRKAVVSPGLRGSMLAFYQSGSETLPEKARRELASLR